MRDIFLLIALIILGIAALRKPQVGILAWLWISVMTPHRLAFGFLYSFPLLDGLALVTILSCLAHWKQRPSASFHPILKILLCFYLWCSLTTIFSVDFMLSLEDWLDFTKTLILLVCILLFMNKKHWIIAFAAVLVLSVGFYGFKGGMFTIATGGAYRVWGATGTDWGSNNGMSMAMLMVIPIALALTTLFISKFKKLVGLGFALSLFIAALGTQSRGGLIGIIGMCGFAIMRTKKKILILTLVIISLGGGVVFMPQSWHDRMATIQNYENEGSANTRLIQWQYAIDISKERPFFGNGFDAFFYQPYYLKHVADKDNNRAVHSNYFQVLGEQGYIGLLMYLSLLITLIVSAKRNSDKCENRADLKWAYSILSALQFSVVGYAVNGITLNMAYLDLFYYIIALFALLISYINKEIKQQKNDENSRENLNPATGGYPLRIKPRH